MRAPKVEKNPRTPISVGRTRARDRRAALLVVACLQVILAGTADGSMLAVTAMVEVSRLIDPAMLVEIEAVAYLPVVSPGEVG